MERGKLAVNQYKDMFVRMVSREGLSSVHSRNFSPILGRWLTNSTVRKEKDDVLTRLVEQVGSKKGHCQSCLVLYHVPRHMHALLRATAQIGRALVSLEH